ncbi:hypothetical protein Tco_0854967 [Tanacetum coccineum]
MDGKRETFFFKIKELGTKEQNQNSFADRDDGVVNWGEHTEEEVEDKSCNHGIRLNNEVILVELTKEDFIDKPLYSRFSKTDSFKGVPHPLTGDYTPKPQQEIDESLYVYGKKGPQKPEISVSDDTFSENSVTTNEKGTPKVNGKNWNEMMERELGEGYSFIKKKCFVCGSLSHLIRNYDFYEKKMAREAELKKQRVFNTGNGVAKPVWNNANRVNHANHFVPRPVQLIAVRQNVNSVRPNVNTGRENVNSVRQMHSAWKRPGSLRGKTNFLLFHVQGSYHKNMEERDQSAGTTDQAEDQPLSSAPLPSSSYLPVISATLASEPTPVAEPTTHHPSPSPEPDDEQTEHIFEQPSPEHQPLLPR